ncbi:hypothetical protein [Bradyrhizobium sp. C9]|uniref:hypothetical protein n=1 Tax=Bradyrhizobium sp. C9 TaxID=142585 RepID=UPI000BE8C56B|nr:hypothetical protein [Bradyrhizobium sp. C9]PDT77156.1 hypothetical protein CO675_11495 [Bradyrhizobium sp. C9]
MTVSKYEFQVELRRLVDKYLTPAATPEDFVLITTVSEEELHRRDMQGQKFPEKDWERYDEDQVDEPPD